MIHSYQKADIVSCLGDRELLFVGDSTVRQIFWTFARKLDRRKADDRGYGGKEHSDLQFSESGVKLRFLWDPFMNKSDTLNLLVQRRLAASSDTVIGKKSGLPALVILGGGLWHAKYLSFENATKEYESSIKGVLSSLQDKLRYPPDQVSIRPGHDFVAIAPVQKVLFNDLKLDKGITPAKVDHLNEILRMLALRSHISVIWSLNKLNWETEEGYIWDGIHNSDKTVDRKADILLNLRCNSILMETEKYPKSKTCCANYPAPNWFQTIYLKLGFFILPPLAWATSGTWCATSFEFSLIRLIRLSPAPLATFQKDLQSTLCTYCSNVSVLS